MLNVVEFMAQHMIRVLHILRGSLERKDLMSSFCTNLDLLCTKILGLITKGLWQTPQENNAPPMLYLLPSRSLAVLKCELIPDAIRAKSDVQQRHKRESTEAFEELGETWETVEGALRLLHQLGFEPEPSDIIECASFDEACMELGRNFFWTWEVLVMNRMKENQVRVNRRL